MILDFTYIVGGIILILIIIIGIVVLVILITLICTCICLWLLVSLWDSSFTIGLVLLLIIV